MASQNRRKSTSLTDKLLKEPFRFSFFQAVRLLQGLVNKWHQQGKISLVGYDVVPNRESLKFASFVSLQFPSSEIVTIERDDDINENGSQDKLKMQVSFMGLSGQSSALPIHYTELQLERLRKKDHGLTYFFDIFTHRSISFFYRAWEKYRLPLVYERAKLLNYSNTDPFTNSLTSLVGIEGTTMKKVLPVNPEALLFYAGYFATPRSSATALTALLEDYFDIPVELVQFIGEWMPLPLDVCCQLPNSPMPGKNNRLGENMVIGEKMLSVEGKFQLVLGPLNRDQYQQLMPGGEKIRTLCQITKLFVGNTFNFNLKYKLLPGSVSGWQLQDQDKLMTAPQQLGWHTWLNPDNHPETMHTLIVDRVFSEW